MYVFVSPSQYDKYYVQFSMLCPISLAMPNWTEVNIGFELDLVYLVVSLRRKD